MREALDIFICCPGLPFQGDTLEQQSLGGSETAAICMGRELARLGHKVTLFSSCQKPGMYDGVRYVNLAEWRAQSTMNPHDVSIVQRWDQPMTLNQASRANFFWCHDQALLRSAAPFKGMLWNVDRILVLSEYMKRQYIEVYGGTPDGVFHVTRNGIELDRFARVRERLAKPYEGPSVFEDGKAKYVPGPPAPGNGKPIPIFVIGDDGRLRRDRKKLVYTARPERGLDNLLQHIFPKILEKVPDARLYLAGYFNPVDQLAPFYAEIDRLMAPFGDKVVWLGNLTKDALYAHYLTAGVYVYPTPSVQLPAFAEISCITAMECQAAGLPFVSSRKGALMETVAPGAGTLIDGLPWQPGYQAGFVDAVVRYMTDDEAWIEASEAGQDHAKELDWKGVAEDWTQMFERVIDENNQDRRRLALHFIRESDIMAARACLPATDAPEAPGEARDGFQDIRARLDASWAFAGDQDKTREQYEKIGLTHTDVFSNVPHEPRFQMIKGWLGSHPDVKNVLDFGCAHGGYAVNLANETGRYIVGVDIDKHSIDLAEKWRLERAKDKDALAFVVGDEDVDLSQTPPMIGFDLLMLFEVLEHLAEPWQAIDKLERWVKPGGTVLITVPYGPWEYLSYRTYPHRTHLWSYDMHDLRNLFKGKDEVKLFTMPQSKCEPLDRPIGWFVLEYTVNSERKPTGRIDMARKLWLARPRQTVSLNVMAGPGAEEHFHKCLRSTLDVVDEVVVVDCGMTDEGRHVCAQYGATVVPSRSPLDPEVGFEGPRNEGLKRCTMDWVLWMDTDEWLVDPHNLQKYLRGNLFNGYSLQQVHFAVDTVFKPDLPVRLFRRESNTGKDLRWFGLIHEHPEQGLNEGPGITIGIGDAWLAHPGYLSEHTRMRRFFRNRPLLEADIKKYPDRRLQKHFICRDNMLMARFLVNQAGGQVGEEVQRLARETIEVYRKYFLGQPNYINADTLQYYSQAVAVLGEGAEVTFRFAANKDGGVPEGEPQRFRFQTMEDLEKEIMWRTKEAAAPFLSRNW